MEKQKIPVDYGLELLLDLDMQFGSDEWKEHSYEYMCCGRKYEKE